MRPCGGLSIDPGVDLTWREGKTWGQTQSRAYAGDRLRLLPCEDDSARPQCANIAHCPRARRMCSSRSFAALPNRIGFMNGRKARESGLQPNAQVGAISSRSRSRCVCATFSDAFPPWQTHEGGATVGLRPFLGKPTRCAIHNRRPPRLGHALSPRRRHVQFNIEKSGTLEMALVAPIPVKWASACRALISACSRNDLDFADNMAAGLCLRIDE